MFDVIGLSILGGIGVLFACGIVFACEKRYEVAVFLVGLSPWIYAVFSYNIPEGSVEKGVTTGSYVRIGLLCLIGVAGILKYLRKQAISPEKLPLEIKLFGAFLLFAMVSTSYSLDPFYTFIRSASFIAFFAFLLGLHSWMNTSREMYLALNSMFYLAGALVIANVCSPLILGDLAWFGDESIRFRGWAGHPNTMGAFCMVAYAIAYFKYLRSDVGKRIIICALIVILAVLHFLTGSRSTLFLAVVAMCVWFVLGKQRRGLATILGAVSLAVVYFGSTPTIMKPFQRETKQGCSITTLTGRPDVWAASYKLIMEKPVLGYGYGVAGKVLSDPRFYNRDITIWSGSARSSLHNGYFSMAIGVGIVFFFIWCLVLLLPLWWCRLSSWSDYKGIILTVMLMCLVLNFVESSATGCASPQAIVFWITWTMAGKMRRGYQLR